VPSKRELDIPALPNAELPNRAPPNAEAPLRAAKLDSARDDEIAEFNPLVEVAPKERVPEETPLEAAAPPRAPDEPANECKPVDAGARPPALGPELKPRACVPPALPVPPKPCHRPSAIPALLLAPDAPNRVLDHPPKPRPYAPPDPYRLALDP
jgi:hypothetical protein